MNTRQKYLGIDPGRSKTGLALVDAAGSILALHIAHTEHIEVELSAFAGKEQLAGIIMGDGTNSKLKIQFPQQGIRVIMAKFAPIKKKG